MARALLITNPAAARTQPRAVDAVMRDAAERRVERRGAGDRRPGRCAAARGVRRGGGGGRRRGLRRRRHHDAGRRRAGGHRRGARRDPGGHRQPAGRQPPHPRLARAGRPGPGRGRAPVRSTSAGWSGPAGAQYFAVACGAGYDARVMAGTLSEHKRRWGMAAYVATTLRLITEIRSTSHVITIDGVEYDAEAAMVLVANCGEVIPPFVRLRAGHPPRRRPARRGGDAGQQLRPERPGRLGPAARRPDGRGAGDATSATPGAGRSGSRPIRSSRSSSTASPAAKPRSPRPWFPERSRSWCREGMAPRAATV